MRCVFVNILSMYGKNAHKIVREILTCMFFYVVGPSINIVAPLWFRKILEPQNTDEFIKFIHHITVKFVLTYTIFHIDIII